MKKKLLTPEDRAIERSQIVSENSNSEGGVGRDVDFQRRFLPYQKPKISIFDFTGRLAGRDFSDFINLLYWSSILLSSCLIVNVRGWNCATINLGIGRAAATYKRPFPSSAALIQS